MRPEFEASAKKRLEHAVANFEEHERERTKIATANVFAEYESLKVKELKNNIKLMIDVERQNLEILREALDHK